MYTISYILLKANSVSLFALSLEDHLELAERMLADQNPGFDVRLKIEMEPYR